MSALLPLESSALPATRKGRATRERLLLAAEAIFGERGYEAARVSDIVAEAAVSHGLFYRHFPDKQALIVALCERGEAGLATAQRAAADAVGGGGPGFGASGQAYVRFALANPGLFRLMMSIRPTTGWLTDVLDEKSAAMRGLRDDVAAVLPDSADAHQRLAAIHAWSLVHGMAMLMLDGMIPPDEALINSISAPQFGETQNAPVV